jgi:deoxyguanosine kinase
MSDQSGPGPDSRRRASDSRFDGVVVRPFFLAIEGPIGVGKTTLARLMQPGFGSELVLEAFEENPFLSNFYGDRARYAFQTQMFFLLSRYRQQQSIPSSLADRPVISDYTFGKDSLFARLNLSGDELTMYRRLYSVLAERTAFPDLVVYLQAETDALMARIAARDRPYERKMDRDYIASVKDAYERYFANYVRAPVLRIDTNDLNYVRDSSALAYVEGEVRRALGVGAYQQSLPQMERATTTRAEKPPKETPRRELDHEILTQFMNANEAMARVGAVLTRSAGAPASEKTSSLQWALRAAMDQLGSLAHSAGFDLEEPRV